MDSKVCTRCKEEKPIGDFHIEKRYGGKPRARCKTCGNSTSAAWRERNAEANAEYLREYYSSNKEALTAYNVKYRGENRETLKARQAEWRRANPSHARVAMAKRRALKLAYQGEAYGHDDVLSLLESQQGQCAYCAVALEDDFHVDHVVPLSRGGGNGADNICLACPPCNFSKGNKLFGLEWCLCVRRKNEQISATA